MAQVDRCAASCSSPAPRDKVYCACDGLYHSTHSVLPPCFSRRTILSPSHRHMPLHTTTRRHTLFRPPCQLVLLTQPNMSITSTQPTPLQPLHLAHARPPRPPRSTHRLTLTSLARLLPPCTFLCQATKEYDLFCL